MCVLYVFVVLLASAAFRWRGIVLVGLACEVLTLTAHAIPGDPRAH